MVGRNRAVDGINFEFCFVEQEMNTTDTEIDLTNLESNALYRIMIHARNIHGTSLPSSMLLINTTEKGETRHARKWFECDLHVVIRLFQ